MPTPRQQEPDKPAALVGRERSALARAAAHAVPKPLLINEWRESAIAATFAVEDPARGEVIARVADAGPRDSSLALGAATAAGVSWSAAPSARRAGIVAAVAGELRERSAELAALLTLEMGKSFGQVLDKVTHAADLFAWYAEEAPRVQADHQELVRATGSRAALGTTFGPATPIGARSARGPAIRGRSDHGFDETRGAIADTRRTRCCQTS